MLQRLSGPTSFRKPGALVRAILIGARRMLEPSPSGVASPTAALISALERIRPNMWMPAAVRSCHLGHLSPLGLAAWVKAARRWRSWRPGGARTARESTGLCSCRTPHSGRSSDALAAPPTKGAHNLQDFGRNLAGSGNLMHWRLRRGHPSRLRSACAARRALRRQRRRRHRAPTASRRRCCFRCLRRS